MSTHTRTQGGGSTDDLDQRGEVALTSPRLSALGPRQTLQVVPVVWSDQRDDDALRFASGEQPYVARVNAAAGLVAALVALVFVLLAIFRGP